MTEKTTRSISIDPDLDKLCQESDANISKVSNKLLREYFAGGKGTEAVYELRVNMLDEEIANLKKEVERKERERERYIEKMKEDDQQLQDAVDGFLDVYQESMDVDTDNAAVQNHAAKAGVPVERFIEELEAAIGGEA